MSKIVDLATDHLPLWAIASILVAIFLLASEIGRFFTRRAAFGSASSDGAERASQGYVVTAIFALLAFMLATTFSMALSRFDTRRLALAQEIEAISTDYLRASLLDQSYASSVRASLREYAHCRIGSKNWTQAQLEAHLGKCQAIRNKLWLETRAAIQPVRTTALASYELSATNDVLNSAARREIAGRAVIPTRVLGMLLICTIAAAAALGSVQAGSPARFRLSTTLLLTLYAITFILILDIDRSLTGSVAVSQRPMEALAAQLDADVP